MAKYILLLGIFVLTSCVNQASLKACATSFYMGDEPKMDSSLTSQTKLICYEQFALRHDKIRKTPIWVAEKLTKERVTVHIPRKDAFHAEPLLSMGERAELSDYKHSVYVRGHMAPAGVMSEQSAQWESFSLANIVPQNSKNNNGAWKSIETSVQNMAKISPVYVVTGPIYALTTSPSTIGKSKVAVPVKLFKAVYQPAQNRAGVYLLTNDSKSKCLQISIKQLNSLTNMMVFPDIDDRVSGKVGTLPLPKAAKCRVEANKS